MIVCIGGVITGHSLLETRVVSLIDHIILSINFVALLVHCNRLLYELLKLRSIKTIYYFIYRRVCKAFVISVLFLSPLLKGAILQEQSLRLERVHQLLPEADTLLAIVLAAKHYNHLLGFLVLHYDDAVLEIKIDENIFRGLYAERLQCLLRGLFRVNALEQIQMLLIGLGKVHLAEEAAQQCFVLLLKQEAEVIGMIVEFKQEGQIVSAEVLIHTQGKPQDREVI